MPVWFKRLTRFRILSGSKNTFSVGIQGSLRLFIIDDCKMIQRKLNNREMKHWGVLLTVQSAKLATSSWYKSWCLATKPVASSKTRSVTTKRSSCGQAQTTVHGCLKSTVLDQSLSNSVAFYFEKIQWVQLIGLFVFHKHILCIKLHRITPFAITFQ